MDPAIALLGIYPKDRDAKGLQRAWLDSGAAWRRLGGGFRGEDAARPRELQGGSLGGPGAWRVGAAPEQLRSGSGRGSAARERLPQRLCLEGAAQPGARIQQRRPGSESAGRRGHSPGSGAPREQAEARRAQDSKDTPAPS